MALTRRANAGWLDLANQLPAAMSALRFIIESFARFIAERTNASRLACSSQPSTSSKSNPSRRGAYAGCTGALRLRCVG